MPKVSCVVFSIILSGLFFSCSGDNLYEFEELSARRDFVIQLLVIPEDPDKDFDFQITFFKTDGYGEILENSVAYNTSGEYEVLRSAVKEYKKVGFTFIPTENVSRVEVRIYNLLHNYDALRHNLENIEGKVTLSYDFETEKEEIIRE